MSQYSIRQEELHRLLRLPSIVVVFLFPLLRQMIADVLINLAQILMPLAMKGPSFALQVFQQGDK